MTPCPSGSRPAKEAAGVSWAKRAVGLVLREGSLRWRRRCSPRTDRLSASPASHGCPGNQGPRKAPRSPALLTQTTPAGQAGLLPARDCAPISSEAPGKWG